MTASAKHLNSAAQGKAGVFNINAHARYQQRVLGYYGLKEKKTLAIFFCLFCEPRVLLSSEVNYFK